MFLMNTLGSVRTATCRTHRLKLEFVVIRSDRSSGKEVNLGATILTYTSLSPSGWIRRPRSGHFLSA